MNKLHIEANSIDELIDQLYQNTTSGANDLLCDILKRRDLKGFDPNEMKEFFRDRLWYGNSIYPKREDLDCPKEAVPAGWFFPSAVKQEETETNMCGYPQKNAYANATTIQAPVVTAEQQAKDYLIGSLDQEMWNKRTREYEAFNLNGSTPKTFGELREALKKGWVIIPEAYDEYDDDERLLEGPCWIVKIGNPDLKPDQKGYDAAMKQMAIDASDVKDQIIVFGPEKGLEALNTFKAKTYH